MSRRRSTHDTSFHGGPEDLGGHFPGKPGNRNPKRSSLFSSTNQPKRDPKPPADPGWKAWDADDPARRPSSLLITDFAELGADVLEELVPWREGGKVIQVTCAYAAMQQGKKYLLAGSRRDWTESLKLYEKLGAIERERQRQARRAAAIERALGEWCAHRMVRLKSELETALRKRGVSDADFEDILMETNLEELIDQPLYEGEEVRLFEQVMGDCDARKKTAVAASQTCRTEGTSSDVPCPEVAPTDAVDATPSHSGPDHATMTEQLGPLETPDCSGDMPADASSANAPSASINKPGSSTSDNEVNAQQLKYGLDEAETSPSTSPSFPLEGDPDDPQDLAHGHLANPTPQVLGPPDPELLPDKPSGEDLQEGEMRCWIKKGPGDQETRNKGGWKHGAKPKK